MWLTRRAIALVGLARHGSRMNAAEERHFLLAALDSFRRFLGRDLVEASDSQDERLSRLFEAPFVMVAHGTEPDPILCYGNRAALELWKLSPEALRRMPSRLTAEPMHRDERALLLERTTRDGYVDDYRGIRISSDGQRFEIERAIVWNVLDGERRIGQAATFDHWRMLEQAKG